MPTTRYIYLGNQYLCEADGSEALTKLYVNEPGSYTNLVSQKELGSGEVLYPLYDALGSTRAVTDEAGDVTDTFVYDAWGNVLDRTGSTDLPFQYVGQRGYYHDAETDLSYVMARIYNPRIIRWLSVDPLKWPSLRLHPYEYVSNAPAVAIDFSGMRKSWHPIGVTSRLMSRDLILDNGITGLPLTSGITNYYQQMQQDENARNSTISQSALNARTSLSSTALSEGADCTVSVCCRKVQVDPTGIGRHCFVLITKSNGDQVSYGGYPHRVGPSGCKDILRACAKPFPGTSGDNFAEPSDVNYDCDHLGTLPCQSTFDCLDGVRRWFFASCCCYAAVWGARPNSNTVARTLLARCIEGKNGVTTSGRPGGGWAPKYYPLAPESDCENPPPGCCPPAPPGCGDD